MSILTLFYLGLYCNLLTVFMLDYVSMIVLFDLISLLLISIITSQNQLISKREKSKFQFTYFFSCHRIHFRIVFN